MLVMNYEEFEKKCLNNLCGKAAVVCGDEDYYIKKCIDKILGIVKMFEELNIIKIDGENATYESIVEASETLPVMSDVKIVYVYNANFIKKLSQSSDDSSKKQNKTSSDFENKISEYIKNLPDTTILLLTLSGDEDERNKIVINARNLGYVFKFKQVRGRQLQDVTLQMFKKQKKNISKSDIIYFLSKVGTSLELIKNEIDKLCDYTYGSDSITRKDIDEVTHKTLESNIFKMVDGIGKKDAQAAVSILDNLLFQKENHLMILGMIIRQYRLLLYTRLYIDEKYDMETIKNKLGIKRDFILDNLLNQVKIYDKKSLIKSLNACLETDMRIKSGSFDIELALEMLIVKLCE